MEWKDVAGCHYMTHSKKNKHFLCFSPTDEKTQKTIIKDLVYLSSQTRLSSQEIECLSSAQTQPNEELFDKVRRGAWSWSAAHNGVSEKDQGSALPAATQSQTNEATEKFYIGYLVSLKSSNSTALTTQFLQFENSVGEKPDFAHNAYNEFQSEAEAGPSDREVNFSKEPWAFLPEGSEAEKPAKEKGTLREQIKNIMTGITQGFTVNLELKGIGYQAKLGKVNELSVSTVTSQPAVSASATGGKHQEYEEGESGYLPSRRNYRATKNKYSFFFDLHPWTKALSMRDPKETQITEGGIHKNGNSTTLRLRILERELLSSTGITQSRTIDKRKHIPHLPIGLGQLEFDIQRISRLKQWEKTRNLEENGDKFKARSRGASNERVQADSTVSQFGSGQKLEPHPAKLDQHLRNQDSVSVTEEKERKTLILNTGHSHELIWPLHARDVCVSVASPKGPATAVTLSVFGISRSVVNQVAAEIYSLKKPEPYKGKGIRYDGERLFLKKRAKK